MLALLALFGCHTIEKTPVEDSGPAVSDCGGTVYQPRSGFDGSEPVPADESAETFGTTGPDPFQVHRSWSDDPSTTMALVWRTDAETLATRVQYGADTTYGTETLGGSFILAGGDSFGRIHEAHLCGLTPGATVHYRVGGEGHWSEDRSFQTAPAPGSTEPVRFVVAGDSRDNQKVWGQILAASEALAPDFYVFTGDAVDLGTNLTEWDAWYANGEGYLDRRPIIQAEGNHEFQVATYYGLVAQPGNEQWFGLDYGPAHIAVLTDTVVETTDFQVQADFLAADLAATTAPWKFAVHHVPAYSSCTTHGSNANLQKVWSPVEEAGGVVMDLTGHNHNYERSYPLRGGAQVDALSGTTYVVAAGAGADLYGNELSNAFTAVAEVTENYVVVEVDGTSVTSTAYDLVGNVLDSFVVSR